MTTKGHAIDYAWGRPHPRDIRDAGIVAAGRYATHDQTGKGLTRSEALALTAYGIDLFTIFEDSSGRALSGEAGGRLDARFAATYHAECGGPESAPIYFADDTDTNTELTKVLPYYQGAAAEIGPKRVRGYGSDRLIDFLAAHGFGPGFQTSAWSGGLISPHAAIYQPYETVRIDGVACDLDTIREADYGGWRHPETPHVTHAEWVRVLEWIRAKHDRYLWAPIWRKVSSHPSLARHWLDTGVIS